MSKKYFNKKIRQRAKTNLKRAGGRRKMLSKRLGGVLHASMVLENRNQNAIELAKSKKEIK